MDSILLHMGLGIGPVYALTLRSIKRLPLIRLLVLLVICTAFFLAEIPRDMANYYDVLNVEPNATAMQIRSAVRKAKQNLKKLLENDDPEEAKYWYAEFEKGADVLTTETFRKAYHRFGDSLDAVMHSDDESVTLAMAVSLARHAVLTVVALAFTIPVQHSGARTLVLLYSLGCMALDLLLRFYFDTSLPLGTALKNSNSLLNFEIVALTRRVYPSVLFLSITLNTFIGYLPDTCLTAAKVTLIGVCDTYRAMLAKVIELSYRTRSLCMTIPSSGSERVVERCNITEPSAAPPKDLVSFVEAPSRNSPFNDLVLRVTEAGSGCGDDGGGDGDGDAGERTGEGESGKPDTSENQTVRRRRKPRREAREVSQEDSQRLSKIRMARTTWNKQRNMA